MKHKWLVLSATALVGSLHANGMQNDNVCGPCCVPKMKRCVDCECYSPAYYDLQCDWGFFVHADFLYWYAKESNLDFVVEMLTVSRGASGNPDNGITYVDNPISFKASWDPGVRVGVGWNTPCDGWDIEANWTYYRTKLSQSKSVPEFVDEGPPVGSSALSIPWNGPFLIPSENSLATQVKGKWEFRINNVDLEIGKRFWTSPCFTFRPFGGLRGSWTKTKFEANSGLRTHVKNQTATFQTQTKNRFDNKFWGVGLLAGIEPTWYWTRCFAFYGAGDIALLWGEYQVQKKETDFQDQNGVVEFDVSFTTKKSDTFFMQPILDVELGLRFEDTYCCDRYRFTLDAGWEHHVWFNHNQRYVTTNAEAFDTAASDGSQVAIGYNRTQHDVSFGGFVLRARFDF